MEPFEKVEKRLECCISNGDCQHQCDKWPDNGCQGELMDDALALIRAQQERIRELESVQTARVMTLEEVIEKSKQLNDCFVFIEYFETNEEFADDTLTLSPCLLRNIKSIFEKSIKIVATFKHGGACWYEQTEYGKTWRCWTQRPTDEQREAVKWE